MKKILLIFILGLSACFYSCEDNDDLQNGGNDLAGRITALEGKVDEINQNIQSLHELHIQKDEVTAISDITEIDRGYMVVLKDGTELPIILDDAIKASIPLIGIDREDYWAVSIGGATVLRIKDSNGKDISDINLLPKLKLDGAGCWMVSYDDGANWEYLGDRNGAKIDAIVDNITVSPSSFVKKYTYYETDETLTLTLLTDEVFTLKVYKAPPPIVSAANSETSKPTIETLSFDITMLNAEEWKYLYKEASETAPTAEEIATNGTLGVGAAVVLQNLSHSTTYRIYVVAIQDSNIYSRVSYAENTTVDLADVIDYRYMYNNGMEFTVGNIVINKTNYPDGTVVTEVKPSEITADLFTKGGILFIDNSDPNDLIYTGDAVIGVDKALVIIGRHATSGSKQAEIVATNGFVCNNNTAVKNIKLTAQNSKNLFTQGSQSSALNIEDCNIVGSGRIIYDSPVTVSFSSIMIHNSTIKLGIKKDLISSNWKKNVGALESLTSLKLTNNVIYSEEGSQCYVVNLGDRNGKVFASYMDIVIRNNTIYNLWQTNILIRTTKAKSVDVCNNVCSYIVDSRKSNFAGFFGPEDLSARMFVLGNYLYSAEGDSAWVLLNGYSKKDPVNTDPKKNYFGATASKDPIAKELNIATGYIPVNLSVITNGAGADYETKHWINR